MPYAQGKIWLRPARLIMAAAIFHLAVTAAITLVGHYGFLPSVIDRNGIAVGIASDGIKIREEAVQRSQELMHGQVRNWLQARSPFYVKLYSICFATFGVVFGTNVLSLEPVNALCYLTILVLVYYLAREFSDWRAALVAAALVAVWPSFLLHTTQLLKDSLFVAGMLAFVLVNVRLLRREFSAQSAILTAIGGGLVAAFVWLARDTMGEILIATALLAFVLLLTRLFVEQRSSRVPGSGWRARIPSLVGLLLLIAMCFAVTRLIPKFKRQQDDGQTVASDIWKNSRRPARDGLTVPESVRANPWSSLIARIGKLRRDFASEFSDAGSNIDADVQIRSTTDAIRYLPRAVMIGYLAPFPNMWLDTGRQVNRGGRLLSGVEMLATYLIEGLAVVGLWYGRRRFSVWFLWLVSAMGLSSLGLVVLNIGALYRLRYVFVILLIILATEGARLVIQHFRKAHGPKAHAT